MSDWNGNTATAERDDVGQVTTGDAEVDAIIGVTAILAGLDEAQRARVLGNANDRFGTTPPAGGNARRGK